MNGHTTWPILLPKKKLSCYRPPDRISLLPDAIQTLILNYLPTKQAFQTSLLSKKWRHLCHSLPWMRFIQSEFDQIKYEMKDVIDQVLRSYKEPSIDWLRIILNHPVPHNHMDEWVSFAVSHHVGTFTFWDTTPTSEALYTFPSIIFTCASLKVLKLKNMRINIPAAAETVFPLSLEYLDLDSCIFTDAVFSTCNYPKLDRLVIRFCQYDTLSVSSSALQHLQICRSVGNPKVYLLSNPSLSSISYIGEDQPNISVETLLSLQLAHFVITADHFRSWDLVGKMLKGLPSVRDLRVGAFYLECLRLNWVRRLLDYPAAPCFGSVKYLRLVHSGKRHVPVLKVLLRSYPNLVLLEINSRVDTFFKETTEDDNNTAQYWEEKEKEKLPANFLFTLAKFDATYGGEDEESEFELIKFVVENAIALRNINIYVGGEVEPNEKNLRQKLNTIPRMSSWINVVISRGSK